MVFHISSYFCLDSQGLPRSFYKGDPSTGCIIFRGHLDTFFLGDFVPKTTSNQKFVANHSRPSVLDLEGVVLLCTTGFATAHISCLLKKYSPWHEHIPWKWMLGRWNFLLNWPLFWGHVNFRQVISWALPPPSNSGKWRFIGIPYWTCNNPGADYCWEGGQPKLYPFLSVEYHAENLGRPQWKYRGCLRSLVPGTATEMFPETLVFGCFVGS